MRLSLASSLLRCSFEKMPPLVTAFVPFFLRLHYIENQCFQTIFLNLGCNIRFHNPFPFSISFHLPFDLLIYYIVEVKRVEDGIWLNQITLRFPRSRCVSFSPSVVFIVFVCHSSSPVRSGAELFPSCVLKQLKCPSMPLISL